MSVSNYLDKVNKHYKSGLATEHTYRGDFADLIQSLVPHVHVTNEPSNVTDCGNPDYVISQNKIPIGFVEAKDLGKNLNSSTYKEQFSRYRTALDNLIITDYVWFQFFQNGELVHEIRIAEIEGDSIKPLPENFAQLSNLIQDFCTFIAQTIKSPKTLAKMMAAKARLLENILENALTSDEEHEDNSALKQQYETFKNVLIHDLSPQGFADIYAQTLSYGMFAARLHDKSLDTFSRQEAAELIPKSNPFLRKLFNHVAGIDIDERIVTTVDNLADVFRATNVEALLKNFSKDMQKQDPIIHFYETFLAEYDPKLRKSRGVWYTPEPVVKFIVRSVDEILKTEFGLKDGLADSSKTKIRIKTDKPDRRTKSGYVEIDKEVHKVQVLDPATGTGTFLAEVVKHIYRGKFTAMQGAWSGYVEEHLIPRLNGFELLMASYSMAHLKLDMLLTELGYQSKKNTRFNIFLTNSLEQYHPDTGTLFSSWLSTEANEANNVKRDTPVMVVMGNPPYAVSSVNKGVWINSLIDDYKRGLNEKKINLDDDYIKFIRYGQNFVEKNGEGVLAYITNNSFLDGLTHREMRNQLLNVFDTIYIVDLHGNSSREETAIDGSKDENVFDIMQGVSINIFIKNRKPNNSHATVFHYDALGLRKDKYEFLLQNSTGSIEWEKLKPVKPNYFFIPKEFKGIKDYESGFSLKEIFIVSGNGIGTDRDKLFYDIEKSAIEDRFRCFFSDEGVEGAFAKKYKVKSSSSYDLLGKRSKTQFSEEKIKVSLYRPFDKRWTYYDQSLTSRPAFGVMENLLSIDNIALLATRQLSTGSFQHVFITDTIVDRDPLSVATRERTQVFPLFIDINKDGLLGGESEKTPNLRGDFIEKISNLLKLKFVAEKLENSNRQFTPHDIFDYIYAVLHSPKYRSKYLEFLKIDFPRIPYPKCEETFYKLVEQGGKLRKVHLLEADMLDSFISSYPIDGSNEVINKIVKKDWELYDNENGVGRIWINKQQYFDGIPLNLWEFSIGGYQPAQKWLKDRNNSILSFQDILHYQKIIVALFETGRIMQRLDEIDFD